MLGQRQFCRIAGTNVKDCSCSGRFKEGFCWFASTSTPWSVSAWISHPWNNQVSTCVMYRTRILPILIIGVLQRSSFLSFQKSPIFNPDGSRCKDAHTKMARPILTLSHLKFSSKFLIRPHSSLFLARKQRSSCQSSALEMLPNAQSIILFLVSLNLERACQGTLSWFWTRLKGSSFLLASLSSSQQ